MKWTWGVRRTITSTAVKHTRSIALKTDAKNAHSPPSAGEVELNGCAVRFVARRAEHDILGKVCFAMHRECHTCVWFQQRIKRNSVPYVNTEMQRGRHSLIA